MKKKQQLSEPDYKIYINGKFIGKATLILPETEIPKEMEEAMIVMRVYEQMMRERYHGNN